MSDEAATAAPCAKGPSLPLGPEAQDFFAVNQLPPPQGHADVESYWAALPWRFREACGWDLRALDQGLRDFLAARTHAAGAPALRSLEIHPGRDKSGEPERHHLRFAPGDVICLVGPTGAGKSRLLADIECMAQGDTPTGRVVTINGAPPDRDARFSTEGRIVAQITQNMNFVMDLSVIAFLDLHAESRALKNPGEAVAAALDMAIGLAGEPFDGDTQLTQLSGGQSRALMIADAAYLSPKPIVLIDEIENAGVDRMKALKLFVEKEKIVLLSTHDPLLALSGTARLTIRNGAVAKVIKPSPKELAYRDKLAILDQRLSGLREALREGEALDLNWDAMVAHLQPGGERA